MTITLNRRAFMGGAAGVAGTALASVPLANVYAQAAPLRIGLLTVKTGPLAQGGIQMEQGTLCFLKEKNYTLAGRKIELIVADTGGTPSGATTKAQELIQRDRVDVLFGPLAASELLAITDYVERAQIPILAMAGAEDLTQRKPNEWLLRVSSTSAQAPHVMADYSAKELGLKRMTTISDDYAYGHEQVAGFQRVFEDGGGKIVGKLWPPVVTPDYTPYIAQVGDTDGMFMGFTGSNPVKFVRGFAALGLKEKMALTASWTAMDDALMKSFGDEAVGVYSAHFYSADLDTSSNQRFVAAMTEDFNALPGGYSAAFYVAGQCVEAALEATGGSADDRKAFMDALRAVSLTDSPRGKFYFDHLGNVVGDMFIRRCERQDGNLVNTIIKTYPDVSQFWTYDEEWFLKQPVYSRDWPPAGDSGAK